MNYTHIKYQPQQTEIFPGHHIALRDPNCHTRIFQLTGDGKDEPFAEVHLVRSESEGRPLLRFFAYTGEHKDMGGSKLAMMTPLFSMFTAMSGYMDSTPQGVALEMADRFLVLCNLNYQDCLLTNCTSESLKSFSDKVGQMVDLFMIHLRREMTQWK